MSDILDLFQTLQMAIKGLLMYTAAHPRSKASLEALTGLIEARLEEAPTLHLATSNGKVFVDGTPFEGQSLHLASTARMFAERQISGVIFSRGLTAEEVQELLELLILKPARIEERGGAGRILADKRLEHIQLGQIQYREVREGESGKEDQAGPAMAAESGPALPLEAPEPRKAPAPPALDALELLLDQWRQEFRRLRGKAQASGGRGLDGKGSGGPGQGMGRDGNGPGQGMGRDGSGPGGPGPALGTGYVEGFGQDLLGADLSGTGLEDGRGHGGSSAWGMDNESPDPGWAGLGELDGPDADLSMLGGSLACVGIGDGFPSALQMEGLRKSILEQPPGAILSILAGLESLPYAPTGLRMAFQALAPEAFAHAAAEYLEAGAGAGEGWARLRERLHGILQSVPGFQGLLAALEEELRRRGLGLENLQELVARMDWDTMGLDEQLQMVMERGHLWKLSPDQRLAFLRRLLDEGRFEAFTIIIEQILMNLTSDEAMRREMAARTLAGVCAWVGSPGLPPECEGPLLQGLAAHFGWEALPPIHRATSEALGAVVLGLVERGEPGQALAVLTELESLCAFLETQEPWRAEAMAWLWSRLSLPAAVDRVLDLLHTANPETLLTELIPYLERVGAPAAARLVEVLGEEQDRKRRGRLVEAIRGLGALALPAVHEALASSKWYLVRNTLNLLADMGDAEELPAAEACLSHADGRVRRAAVRTVWKLGGSEAIPALSTAFTAADQETMFEIMFAFGQLRSGAVVPLLGGFAVDKRMPGKLRARAAETLGLIGDPLAQPYLEDLVRRRGRFITTAEPIEVRLAGCKALLALGSPGALASLREMVSHEPRNSDRPLLQQLAEQARR